VFVYDALNLRAVTVIEAHSSTVTCVALSNKGDKLATASEKVVKDADVVLACYAEDSVRLHFEHCTG